MPARIDAQATVLGPPAAPGGGRRRSAGPAGASLLLALITACWPTVGSAASGRLLATGGASTFEGAAGGGIVPWAVIAGYGTREEWGAAAFATRVDSGDYRVDAHGVALGVANRIELSIADQRLHLPTLADALGLPSRHFDQRVLGAKLRLGGDLVYGPWGQFALGVQHKHQRDFAVPAAVGARDDRGTDLYLQATKLWLEGPFGRHWLLSAGLRSTRANQAGLLGFGGDRQAGRSLVFEGSLAVLLDRRWAVGIEYRQKPDNLGFAREDDWRDAFVAFFPNKRVSVVAAWADLGDIATLGDQRAWYLSLQVSR